MLVAGINLNVEGSRKYLPQTTKATVGLYQINSTMQEWAKSICTELVSYEGERPLPTSYVTDLYSKNREWVQDDTLLIEKAIQATYAYSQDVEVALISKDKRLANQMMKSCNCRVILITPLSAYETFRDRGWNSTTEITPLELYRSYDIANRMTDGLTVPKCVLIDTGSVLSELHNKEFEENAAGGDIITTTAVSRSLFNQNSLRRETIDRVKKPISSHPRYRVYDSRYLGQRRNRPKSGSYSTSERSGSFSWSSGSVRGDIPTTRKPLILKPRKGS
jgi:hypothetical protein